MYKYLCKLEERKISYIVLEYDKNKNEKTKKYENKIQQKFVKNTVFCKKCEKCKYKNMIKPTRYEDALNQYIKQEFEGEEK